jgi:mono/diheme cytochrome c family protein
MKTHPLLLITLLTLLLAGCSFSLTEDITPPPGYQSPTPLPPLGPLYPPGQPSPARGAVLYASQCASCHGDNGLGNGPQSDQLSVSVPAIGLEQVSSQFTPAEWYMTVSQGQPATGMPSFAGLSAVQRWDVLAYVFSLGSSAAQLEHGKALYVQDCSSCHGADGRTVASANFGDQQFMAGLSGASISQTLSAGLAPHAQASLTAEDDTELGAYLRSLSFDLSPLPTATPTPPASASPLPTAPSGPTPYQAGGATPSSAQAGLSVSGSVSNGSGAALPANLTATLEAVDSSSNQELASYQAAVAQDGSYQFTGIQPVQNATYFVMVGYQGISYFSQDFVYSSSGAQSYLLPVVIYQSTSDLSSLQMLQVHIQFQTAANGAAAVAEWYVFTNPGISTVNVTASGSSIPFIQIPSGATNLQYQLASGSPALLPSSAGFAVPPSTNQQYAIVVLFDLPYDRSLSLNQPFVLPVDATTVMVPQGARLSSNQLAASGTQTLQGTVYSLFQASSLPAGGSISMIVSGLPGPASQAGTAGFTSLRVGLGSTGGLLILAGVILFLVDQAQWKRELEEERAEAEALPGEERDGVLDAILALDDAFKSGSLTEEIYARRRAELKERLRELL